METLLNLWGRLAAIDLPQIQITDIIQIILIAVALYYILVWVRNTRTWFLIRGILILLLFYAVAEILELNTILFIFRNALGVVVTAMVVVFHPELRKALEQLGTGNMFLNSLTGGMKNPDGFSPKTVEELVKASFLLGSTRTGALIVIERQLSLQEYIDTGIEVDAVVSSPLLINIFEHNTPLHDGAVVVQGNRVAAATCYLPLSKNPEISKELGTRHRAAIGVSEVTDSVTIVVSEETGKVSVAQNGRLTQDYEPEELREFLDTLLERQEPRQTGLKFWKGLRKNAKTDSE